MQGLANPARFLRLSKVVQPWLAAASILLIGSGLYFALFDSPADYQQGQTVRIMYVHVPSAWLGMVGYSTMALASAVGLIWKHPLADLVAKATAPIGASFTFLCLATGSLWGTAMWGTWWAWDARLTSMLILLFLYLGYMALQAPSTIRRAVRGRRRSWPWPDSSMCRSSSSRSIGGRHCTSRRV